VFSPDQKHSDIFYIIRHSKWRSDKSNAPPNIANSVSSQGLWCSPVFIHKKLLSQLSKEAFSAYEHIQMTCHHTAKPCKFRSWADLVGKCDRSCHVGGCRTTMRMQWFALLWILSCKFKHKFSLTFDEHECKLLLQKANTFLCACRFCLIVARPISLALPK